MPINYNIEPGTRVTAEHPISGGRISGDFIQSRGGRHCEIQVGEHVEVVRWDSVRLHRGAGLTAYELFAVTLRNDREYAWVWHCNIAMSAVDEGVEHETANRAAARFMKLAFDIDVTEFPEWQAFDWS